MNKTKLVWRLANRPTSDEVLALINNSVISKDEGREILFSLDTEEDRDKKSLESEIKFLRELVEKLSSDKTRIVEVIKEVYKPYQNWGWYQPYYTWTTTTSDLSVNGTNTVYLSSSSLNNQITNTVTAGFSDIKTF